MNKKKGAIHFKDGHVEYILTSNLIRSTVDELTYSVVTNDNRYLCIQTVECQPIQLADDGVPITIKELIKILFKTSKVIYEYFNEDLIAQEWIPIDGIEKIEFYPKKKRRLTRRLKWQV